MKIPKETYGISAGDKEDTCHGEIVNNLILQDILYFENENKKKNKKQKGQMDIEVVVCSLEEAKLLSDEVQQILKTKFKMERFLTIENIFCINNVYKSHYKLIFDTKENALAAASWLNDILRINSQNLQTLL